MLFLLLQTFAWMLLAGFLGAMLGCVTRRIFAPIRAAVPAASTGVTPGVATRGPMIEASTAPAPAPAPVMAAAPAPSATAKRYDYPITTIGIPRGTPELVQPHIQRIDLTVAPPAAAPAAATVKIVAPPAASVSYPITTIGIPPAVPGPFPPSTATPAALVAVRGDAARFERALTGQVTPPAPQPRPEPLRPELSGTAAPVAASRPAEVPLTPVAAAAAGAAAAAAAAARASSTQQAPPVAVAEPVVAKPATATAGDDFTRIRAIDPDLQRRLNALGVTRFSDLAKLSPGDVSRLSQALGLLGRVEQENWIEQAQILASGGDTYYSRRRQRGEIPAASPAWAQPQPQAETPGPKEPSAPGPVTAAMASPSSVTPAAAAAASLIAATGAAASTAAANASVDAKPTRLLDAIRTNQDRPAANDPRARTDLSGLRSVRSEALRPDTGDTGRSGQPRPLSQIDDLKRVRGIGVLIEKKLNSLGITTYEQIANWTNADIDRVSQILDFKGRIERENWVEQSRILASGGNTDFSRRVDRGEA